MTLLTAQQVNTCMTHKNSTLYFVTQLYEVNVCKTFGVIAARVGPSVPRQERPARDGARVASIETGLAAAAAKLSHQVCHDNISHHYFYYSCKNCPTKKYVPTGGATENQEKEEKHQKEGNSN